VRRCTRNGCPEPAVATLTYIYAASTAVVGPLAVHPEPHSYDLCETHARTLTAPRGWDLVRHDGSHPPVSPPDDLLALAEAVREDVREAPEVRTPPDPRRPRLRLVPPA
jgi:Protein of unknown function (DUF3499)